MIFGAKILRICLTAIVALITAMLFYGPLFLVLWPTLYWAWHLLGQRRAAQGLKTPLWIAEEKSPRVGGATKASGMHRLIRAAGWVFAAMLAVGLLLVFINIELEEHRAKEARALIHQGMFLSDVLQSVRGGSIFLACAGPPAALGFNGQSRKFYYRDAATNVEREISDSEAVALLRQNLGHNDRWCVEYFFGGAMEHFSFQVVFDREGRVQNVTPLFGSFE